MFRSVLVSSIEFILQSQRKKPRKIQEKYRELLCSYINQPNYYSFSFNFSFILIEFNTQVLRIKIQNILIHFVYNTFFKNNSSFTLDNQKSNILLFHRPIINKKQNENNFMTIVCPIKMVKITVLVFGNCSLFRIWNMGYHDYTYYLIYVHLIPN